MIKKKKQQNSAVDARYAIQLRTAGFKATPAKLRLLALLANSSEPLSVQSIYRLFKSPAPDKATVYRSLKDFHTAGLIKQINFQHGHAHYEYAGQKDHHHLICNNCGVVEDIVNCNLNEVIKKALRNSKQFKSISDHSFELFGVCRTCSSSNLS